MTVAILDTGIAYRNWRQFHRSPDFNRTRFVDPYDFVARNGFPLDREGHGTFVAGIVAESTNNGIGLTGLAYGASIMPVRVLDRYGDGNAATIARGVRYAVRHHAQVINLSLEFYPNVTAGDIPTLIGAIRYAARHHVVVVGAAGNDYASQVAYPARAPTVISVGATTRDRCLAAYSNVGSRLDLVAPGGGGDKAVAERPELPPRPGAAPDLPDDVLQPQPSRPVRVPGRDLRHVDVDAGGIRHGGAHHRQPDPRPPSEPGADPDPARADGAAARDRQAQSRVRVGSAGRRRGDRPDRGRSRPAQLNSPERHPAPPIPSRRAS